MAMKKISFSDLAAQNNSSTSSELTKALSKNEESIIQVKPLKTTFEEMNPNDLQLDPKEEFTKLYPLENERVDSLSENMSKKGYDKSQCIHIARFEDEPETGEITIDGHHRRAAAIKANIEKVTVYRHVFETRNDGKIYALELQLHRRNEDKQALYNDFLRLKKLQDVFMEEGNTDFVPDSGKQAAADAKLLGTSTRQVEKMNAITKSDRKDLQEEVASGKKSVNAAYNELKDIKPKPKKPAKTEEEFEEDISDSLSDNTGVPTGLNFSHSDGHERPEISVSAETEIEAAKKSGRMEGFADGFYKGYFYVLAQLLKGREAKDIYLDVEDFSPTAIKDFVLSAEDEDSVLALGD